MKRMEEQVQEFMAFADDERTAAQYDHFLDYMVPCLTEFFLNCEDPSIRFSLEESGQRMAHTIAAGLVGIANGCRSLSAAQSAGIQAFEEVMTRAVGVMGIFEFRFTAPGAKEERAVARGLAACEAVAREGAAVGTAGHAGRGPVDDEVTGVLQALQALHDVQRECSEVYQSGTLKDAEEFGALFMKDWGGGVLDKSLFSKLMVQIMEGAGTTATVGLLRCFTALLDRHKAGNTDKHWADRDTALKDLQVRSHIPRGGGAGPVLVCDTPQPPPPPPSFETQWCRGRGANGAKFFVPCLVEGGTMPLVLKTLKTFFPAKTRNPYYRIHISIPPKPSRHTHTLEVCML